MSSDRKRGPLRWIFWIFLFLFGLILLLGIAINLPAVQNYLIDRVTTYVAQKTGTACRIGSIQLRITRSLRLTDVYIEDLDRDTLLSANVADVHFSLARIWQRAFDVKRVNLQGVHTELKQDSTGTFNFEEVLNRVAPPPENPRPPSQGSSAWTVAFPDTQIKLQTISASIDMTTLRMAARIGNLELDADRIDLEALVFLFDEWYLSDVDIDLNLPPIPPDTTRKIDTDTLAADQSQLTLHLGASYVQFDNISYHMAMSGSILAAEVPHLLTQSFDFQMTGDSLGIVADTFAIDRGRFGYDLPDQPVQETAFDPNHILLSDIHTAIADFTYDNLDIQANVHRLAANERCGAQLKNFHGQVDYRFDTIELFSAQLLTPNARLDVPEAFVGLPFLSSDAPLDATELRVAIASNPLRLDDLLCFAPLLAENPYLAALTEKDWQLQGRVDGTLANLQVPSLMVREGPNQVWLSGTFRELLHTDRLAMDVQLGKLYLTRDLVASVLPESSGIMATQIPETLSASGAFIGTLDSLNVELKAQAQYPGEVLSTLLTTNAVITNTTDPDQLAFEARIDTLFTTRGTLINALPPGTLPEYMELPTASNLQGAVSGNMRRLDLDLLLNAYRPESNSKLSVRGAIEQYQQPDSLLFDLELDDLHVTEKELLAYLPLDTMPGGVSLPRITSATGKLAGSLDDLSTNLILETNAGIIQTEIGLAGERYQGQLVIDSLRLQEVLDLRQIDTLLANPLSPFRLTLAIDGTGTNIDSNLQADLSLNLMPQSNILQWQQGFQMDGKLVQRQFRANAQVNEPGYDMIFQTAGDLSTGKETLALDLGLKLLDFESLALTTKPFRIGIDSLTVKNRGLDLNDLEASVFFDKLEFLYDSTYQQIDSIDLEAEFLAGNNRVSANSDWFAFLLSGKFFYPEILGLLREQLAAPFRTEKSGVPAKAAVTFKDNYFSFYAELFETEILESGLIPGLSELATPIFLNGNFDGDQRTLQAYSEINGLIYNDIRFEEIATQVNSRNEDLAYEASIKNVFPNAAIQIPNLTLKGDLVGGLLESALTQVDTTGQDRFNIEFFLLNDGRSLSFKLQPDLLINYDQWKIDVFNEIKILPKKIASSDWKLQRNEQFIQLISDTLANDLRLAFGNFRLQTISNIIKMDADYFDGRMAGVLHVKEPFGQPTFDGNIFVDSFHVLNNLVGDLTANLENPQVNQYAFGVGLRGGNNDLKLTGEYRGNQADNPISGSLKCNNFDLTTVAPLAEAYVRDLTGQLQGELNVSGDAGQPKVRGSLSLLNSTFRLTLLNSLFSVEREEIAFTRQGIQFDDFVMRDTLGQPATINGLVNLDDPIDPGFDLKFNVQNFLLLNTRAADNELYYGTLIANGSGSLRGTLNAPVVRLTAAPRPGSDLTYVYSYGDLRASNRGEGIVEFLAPLQEKEDALPFLPDAKRLQQASSSGYEVDVLVNAEINDFLKVKVITNELTGDNFKGKAKGNLAVRLFPSGNIELTGRLELVEGRYQFSYNEFIKREFKVVEGGFLNWVGNPYNPDLNVSARYETKASPFPLVASRITEEEASTYKRRVTFYADVNVSGSLEETEINTDILYPDISSNPTLPEVDNALSNLSTDASQSNTQAFSLILFNGFLSQEVAGTGGLNATVSDNLNDFIGNQLNDLADRYINFVDIDFGIENTSNSNNFLEDADFRVSLKKSFLNDRLLVSIDGVASGDTNDNEEQATSQAYLDNVTVEYLLTPEGQVRVKVYNQQDIDDALGGDVVRVGGAIVFSKNFDNFRFFGKKKGKDQ